METMAIQVLILMAFLTNSFQEVWTDVTRKVKGKWVVVVNHPHWVGEVGDAWPPWME